MTREEYLNAAVEKLRPLFERNNLMIPPYRVSCGFTSKASKKVLGQCFAPECTSDGITQIFVVPTHPDVISTLATLVHELLHAASGDYKHGNKFKDGMKVVGLAGKATATCADESLLTMLEKIAEELGEYPNPPLKLKEPSKRDKANSKKSFKLHCPQFRDGSKECRLIEVAKGGDYTVTVSRKSLKLGFPLCPGCSKEMEMESEDFELYKLGEQ
jgi:hypothetical protein